MKNKLVWAIGAVVLLVCAVLCLTGVIGIGSDSEPGEAEVCFDLKVTVGGEQVVYDAEVTVAEGTVLIDAMTTSITENGGVVYSDDQYGAYITSICGHGQNPANNEYWVYTVNGEQAMVGASEYCPAEGDAIVFDLSPLVW